MSELKKIVRMAPSLVFYIGRYFISNDLFSSEEEAKKNYYFCATEFKKWLIDTHGIDVEVGDE